MRFRECPNCGNFENGFAIYKCDSCKGLFCFKHDEGCGEGNECPHCGESQSSGVFSLNVTRVGEIENDD
jgi:DNA-directed RNA polymerase subunit RPC12/RpoP